MKTPFVFFVALTLIVTGAFASDPPRSNAGTPLRPASQAWTGLGNAGFETNGGVNTTILPNWLEYNTSGSVNAWYAQTGTTSPSAGCVATVVAPTEGTYAAMTGLCCVGYEILFQDMVLPVGQYVLAMDVYLHAGSAYIQASSLDPAVTTPQNQLKVDIMDPAVGALGTSVLKSVYSTNASTPLITSGYFTVRASLGRFSGQTIRLRVGQGNTTSCFVTGVDNVRITPGSVNSTDFNLDGHDDLLWLDSVSGNLVQWYQNNLATTGSATVTTALPPSWKVVGTGDFNQDGVPDILFQNSSTGDVQIWLMNSSGVRTGAVSLGAASTDWKIYGVGDFNNDGLPDILWRSTSTGTVVVWFMNGTSFSGSASIGSAASVWRIELVTDLDRDGKADILWRNTSTGDLSVWLMNGTAIRQAVGMGTVPTNWLLQAYADLNGDGNPDLIWRDSSSGATSVWYMDGATQSGSGSLPVVATNWQLVGPR